MELRSLHPNDRSRLAQLLGRIPQFLPAEVDCALELVELALANPKQRDYLFCMAERDGALLGYACYGPTPMTRSTYDLYWIASDRGSAARGVGTRLMKSLEADILRRGGQLVRVETSSKEDYGGTRGFYEKRGYAEAARIPGFYALGDDLVVLTKSLG